MKKNKVYILLTVYNCEHVVKKQIDSIINQTYQNWEMLVRDDGSTDSTIEIVNGYIAKDSRIKMINNNNEHLYSAQNFSKLMEALPFDSSYIMFSDHDDIWLPQKIEKSLLAMKELEDKHGEDKHLVVYGTYKMIDIHDNPLKLEVPDYSTYPTLNLILSQNYIYGCTMMINHKTLLSSTPVALTAWDHDYWIVLSTLVNGGYFAYLNEPALLYRQHSGNNSGNYTNAFLINRLKRVFNNSEIKTIQKSLRMFTSLFERNKDKMTKESFILLKGYLDNVKHGGFKAFYFCLKNKIRRKGMIQTVLFYYNLLRTPKLQ